MRRFAVSMRFALLPLIVLSLVAGSTTWADNGPNHRVRNLRFGVSGGNVKDATRRFCCSGTLGALVTDGTKSYILSNNHVMGLSGQATAGDDISQPGLIDNGCRIATVVADFTVAPPLSSGVDCAIAELIPGTMDPTGFIEDIGVINSNPRAPSIGLAVRKSGRTTGHTVGTVSSINATVNIKYPTSCGGNKGPVFTFTSQVVINSSTFSAGGDSGSLIVTNDNLACIQPVALLFAGSSTTTIGNPINTVLSRLSASLGRTVSFPGTTCAALTSDEEELPGLSRAAVNNAIAIKEKHENRLMSKASVVGIGVGADDNNAEPVIVVYIDETTGIRPQLPRRIDGVRVKRVYTDPIIAY